MKNKKQKKTLKGTSPRPIKKKKSIQDMWQDIVQQLR